MQHVLVIDDELDILDSVEAVLDIDGYKTSRCSEPLKAIALMKTLKPDLVILDVMMPMKSGPEILLEMKSTPELKKIPCILMSAGTNVNYEQEKYGWDIYMKKPFDLDDLLANVKKLI
ncbi:MAG: response regulator transcription factor [Bacteriovoracaceae bacterium]